MFDIRQLEPLWGEWHVESLIGEGTYGMVWKASRQEMDETSYSAVKAITIPQNEDEIKKMKEEGFDDADIQIFFQVTVVNVLQEIKAQGKFSEANHIVRIEEHEAYEFTDGLGWIILIRMELLTNLADYAAEKPLSVDDTVKLGIHMCRALELCERNDVIHRDIKPDNIFVSSSGEFKLGDFGIARQMGRTLSGLLQTETVTCMAPEVFRGDKYDGSADIYSLGIVMYYFLNENQLPFLQEYPKPILSGHWDAALQRRMSGERCPALQGISLELNRIVQKACSFNQEDRFASAAEMREALESLQGTQHVSFENNYTNGGTPAEQSGQAEYTRQAEGIGQTEDIGQAEGARKREGSSVDAAAISAHEFGALAEKYNVSASGFANYGVVTDVSDVDTLARSGDDFRVSAERFNMSPDEVDIFAEEYRVSVEDFSVFDEMFSVSAGEVSVSGDGVRFSGDKVKVLANVVKASADEVKASADEVKVSADEVKASVDEVRASADKMKASVKEVRASADEVKASVDEVKDSVKMKRRFLLIVSLSANATLAVVLVLALFGGNVLSALGIKAGPGAQVNAVVKEGTTSGVEGTLNVSLKGKGITDEMLAAMVLNGEIPDNVTTLDLSANQITDITPLQTLAKLTDLDLSENMISDITPLGSLSKMTRLILSKNTISDIAPLKSMINLSELRLRENSISDAVPISLLFELKILDLGQNAVQDLTPLRALINMQVLDLDQNAIDEIGSLKSMTDLQHLNLENNSISDLSPLRTLTSLSELALRSNPIKDISSLGSLTSLTTLFLDAKSVNSIDYLKPLKSLSDLHINLSNSALRLKELQEALPRCTIHTR